DGADRLHGAERADGVGHGAALGAGHGDRDAAAPRGLRAGASRQDGRYDGAARHHLSEPQKCAHVRTLYIRTEGAEREGGGCVGRLRPATVWHHSAGPWGSLWVVLARVRSAAVLGIDAYLVDVETDITNGLPTFVTVGLPQGAVKEGRERVYAALANTGYTFPLKRVTINLAPADIQKSGSAFDLPIALGVLSATEQISGERLATVAVLGELGLEGAVRPVRGALPVALACRAAGLD